MIFITNEFRDACGVVGFSSLGESGGSHECDAVGAPQRRGCVGNNETSRRQLHLVITWRKTGLERDQSV